MSRRVLAAALVALASTACVVEHGAPDDDVCRAPRIAAVAPGDVAPGDVVHVTGDDLQPSTARLEIDGPELGQAPPFVVDGPTAVHFVAPPHEPGVATLTWITPCGADHATLRYQ